MLQGPLFGVHVSSLLFAYASFALACVIGITYVLLFKEIKAKHLGFFYARLPSLQVLDRMNQRAIVIGWMFLTVGLIVGAIWAAQARGYGPAIRACRRCRCRIRRSSPRSCAGSCIRSSCLRRGGSAGAAGGRRICRRSVSHRAAELRADQLLLHDEPQFLRLVTQAFGLSLSMHLFCRHQSSHRAGRTARAVDFRRGGCERRCVRWPGTRLGCTRRRGLHVQSRGDVRGLRRTDAAREDLGRFFSEYHGVDRPISCRTSTTSPISTPRAICSASRPASTRWSSASRRFSAR